MSFAKKLLPLIFGIILLAPHIGWADSAQFECGEESDTTTQPAVPKTGATKAVVIYATWDSTTNPKKDTMPDWWARVWDSTKQLSVPKFYKDNSLGKYMISARAFGRTSDTCWTGWFTFPEI